MSFERCHLNQRGTNHVGPTLIPYQSPKLIIVAVLIFRNASFPAIFFSEFDLTLTAYSYGLKPQISKTTTFLESSGRALSHGPTLDRSYLNI